VNRIPLALAALAVLSLAPAVRADPLTLRFKGAIYQDDKEGSIRDPEGVACAEGTLWVADTGNARLLKFGLQGGLPVSATVVKHAELLQPTALGVDGKGTVWVLDRKARKIGRVNPDGAFAGWLEVKGVETPAAIVPLAFQVDAAGGVVLLDGPSRKVLVLNSTGLVVRSLPLPPGDFVDVAGEAGGTIYAVDATGSVVWSAEKAATAFKPLTKGMKDVLVFPSSITDTGKGVLVLADQHGHGIVLVGVDGTFQGRQLDMGWNEGVLYYPAQTCLGAGGDLYVADRGNNRVQVFATQR
jgi:DNA-binding beta-propeller fold protein YncE